VATQKVRIKLKSFDHQLLDKWTEKIIKTIKLNDGIVSGPIPLPTKKTVYTVLRSPHVDKKSREQFETRYHKRLIDILNASNKMIEALTKLEAPGGVDIEMKVNN
jgi:small subunit ribosomal protein S10